MKNVLSFTILCAVAVTVRAQMAPIDGTNSVGFAAINAVAGASTIIAVPFEACLDGGAGMLADLVATNGLTSHASDPALADQLVVLTNGVTMVYCYYYFQTGTGWQPVTTSLILPGGAIQELDPPSADAFPVSRGHGFWIKRVAGEQNTVYVKGQVPEGLQSTPIAEGLNLVGVGSGEEVTLNGSGINWTGAYGGTGNTLSSDKIIVCNSNGTFSRYYFYNPAVPEFPALAGKWVTSGGAVANVTINPGQGFWYLRQSGQSGFSFQPDAE